MKSKEIKLIWDMREGLQDVYILLTSLYGGIIGSKEVDVDAEALKLFANEFKNIADLVAVSGEYLKNNIIDKAE